MNARPDSGTGTRRNSGSPGALPSAGRSCSDLMLPGATGVCGLLQAAAQVSATQTAIAQVRGPMSVRWIRASGSGAWFAGGTLGFMASLSHVLAYSPTTVTTCSSSRRPSGAAS